MCPDEASVLRVLCVAAPRSFHILLTDTPARTQTNTHGNSPVPCCFQPSSELRADECRLSEGMNLWNQRLGIFFFFGGGDKQKTLFKVIERLQRFKMGNSSICIGRGPQLALVDCEDRDKMSLSTELS